MGLPGSGILLASNEAAATLTLGTDCFRNERKRVSSKLRYIDGVAVVGSAVIDDASLDLYVEDFYVGRYTMTRIGVVSALYPDDVQPIRPCAVPPGSAISAVITDAPATNALKVTIFGIEK